MGNFGSKTSPKSYLKLAKRPYL